MFCDEVTVTLSAGHGGRGCLSFRREKYLPRGGPNGGNGGRGGDVVLVCDENVGDLSDLSYRPERAAANGQPGQGSDRHGANGAPCELVVPPGTVVHDTATGRQVCELTEHGRKVTLLKGGVGGKGNAFFKSSTNQAPRKTTPGLPGESGVYRLELRSIADVGLVGFPNAGKSTLLGLLSNARPRTADYPFTTLTPMLGVLPPAGPDGRPVRIADIPGLIEGASENRGLGHRFLRHIERCGLLLVLIDAAATDARDPVEDYRQLVHELSLYGAGLEAKPRLVVANKMDEPGANEQLPRLEKACAPARVLALSCLSEEGLPGLKQALRERVGAAPAAPGPASG